MFKPGSARDVATLVLVARLTRCPFAVKGGGHAAFAGASSVERGVIVSMERMKQVLVSGDKKMVDVGPGNRWVDVYSALEKDELAVIGGRVSAFSLDSSPFSFLVL